MTDYFKMFLIALVTAIATQLVLTPYVLRLQGVVVPGVSDPATAGKVEQGQPGKTDAAAPKLFAPNLDGMTVIEAEDRFRDKGIKIIEDGEREGSGAKPGTVVQQRPAAGEELSSKEIRVIVAKSSDEIKVPSVVGKPAAEASEALTAAGFQVPDPKTEASDKPKGTVLRQLPGPGATAGKGSVIRLIVAEAAAVTVPKVRGMYLRKAKKVLAAAGLAVGRIRRIEDEERNQSLVLRQTPAPGDKVPPGTEVELVIVAPN